jgi:hypothetical protein
VGALRIHGELLKLGIDISERTVSRLLPKGRKLPSQTWRTFLDNHLREIVSIDFLTVPTATFRVLYVLVERAHDRRRVLHFNVTEHPTAAWTAQQIILTKWLKIQARWNFGEARIFESGAILVLPAPLPILASPKSNSDRCCNSLSDP